MKFIFYIFFLILLSGCQKGPSSRPPHLPFAESTPDSESLPDSDNKGDWTSSGLEEAPVMIVEERAQAMADVLAAPLSLSSEIGVLCLAENQEPTANLILSNFHTLTYYSFFLGRENLISAKIKDLTDPLEIIEQALTEQIDGSLKTSVQEAIENILILTPDTHGLSSPPLFSTQKMNKSLKLPLPDDCQTVNLSLRQIDPETQETTFVFINPDLYAHLSPIEQAIVILYESYAAVLGYTNYENESSLQVLIANLFSE